MTEVEKTCKILAPVPLRSLALLSRLVSLCGDQQGRAFVLYLLLKERRTKTKRDQAIRQQVGGISEESDTFFPTYYLTLKGKGLGIVFMLLPTNTLSLSVCFCSSCCSVHSGLVSSKALTMAT